MAHEKLTRLLSESLCVTSDEATGALKAMDWDVLKAAELLQREQRMKRIAAARKAPARGWFARLFGA